MIYGVFSGCYSDWRIIGYFENKDDAEKYVVSHNDIADEYDEYYILEVNNLKLTEEQKNLKVKQYHHVVFDYENGKFVMRNEPDRYSLCLNDKERMIKIGHSYKWVSFYLMSEDREKAEKICQDLISQIHYYCLEWEDIGEVIKVVCPNWKLYEIFH